MVAKAAHQQVGLILGQASKTEWGHVTCSRAVRNIEEKRYTTRNEHDSTNAHNLDDSDDGKEEGNVGG